MIAQSFQACPSLFPLNWHLDKPMRKTTGTPKGFPTLSPSLSRANPGPNVRPFTLAPYPNSNKSQSHFPLPTLSNPFWTFLGACPAFQRKLYYVSNKCLYTLFVHVWNHQSGPLDKIWVVESRVVPPLKKPQIKEENKISTGPNFHSHDPSNDAAGLRSKHTVKASC